MESCGLTFPIPFLLASTRLAVLSSSLTHWKKLPPLPSLTSQPHQVLASEPIPFSDLQQVSHTSLSPLPFPNCPHCSRRVYHPASEEVGSGVREPYSLPPLLTFSILTSSSILNLDCYSVFFFSFCLSHQLFALPHSLFFPSLPSHPPIPPFLDSLSHVSLFLSSLALLPQVSRIAAYAYSALSQIRVDAKEELVVQFGIP